MSRWLAALIIATLSAPPLLAQSQPTYIQFNASAAKGALYKPESGPAPHVAVL